MQSLKTMWSNCILALKDVDNNVKLKSKLLNNIRSVVGCVTKLECVMSICVCLRLYKNHGKTWNDTRQALEWSSSRTWVEQGGSQWNFIRL